MAYSPSKSFFFYCSLTITPYLHVKLYSFNKSMSNKKTLSISTTMYIDIESVIILISIPLSSDFHASEATPKPTIHPILLGIQRYDKRLERHHHLQVNLTFFEISSHQLHLFLYMYLESF